MGNSHVFRNIFSGGSFSSIIILHVPFYVLIWICISLHVMIIYMSLCCDNRWVFAFAIVFSVSFLRCFNTYIFVFAYIDVLLVVAICNTHRIQVYVTFGFSCTHRCIPTVGTVIFCFAKLRCFFASRFGFIMWVPHFCWRRF